jgi:hypothetical protein
VQCLGKLDDPLLLRYTEQRALNAPHEMAPSDQD